MLVRYKKDNKGFKIYRKGKYLKKNACILLSKSHKMFWAIGTMPPNHEEITSKLLVNYKYLV